MTKNELDSYFIDSIDEVKTIENGKKTCSQYRPLVEKRIRQLLVTPTNSSSLVMCCGNSVGRNNFERQLIERCSWNEDQITNFINNILNLAKTGSIAGAYLKYKYIYDWTDKEIASKLKITDRTLRNHKSKAYFQIAIWSNRVEYIYLKTFHFVIT